MSYTLKWSKNNEKYIFRFYIVWLILLSGRGIGLYVCRSSYRVLIMRHHQYSRLKKCVKILISRHKKEIINSPEWMYNLWGWTININTGYKYYSVVAYRAENNKTDFSNYIKLPKIEIKGKK